MATGTSNGFNIEASMAWNVSLRGRHDVHCRRTGSQGTLGIEGPDHLMSLMPGAEYTSSCRFPLRTKNSMAAKSFLLMCTFFSNSVLAKASKCGRVSCVLTIRK